MKKRNVVNTVNVDVTGMKTDPKDYAERNHQMVEVFNTSIAKATGGEPRIVLMVGVAILPDGKVQLCPMYDQGIDIHAMLGLVEEVREHLEEIHGNTCGRTDGDPLDSDPQTVERALHTILGPSPKMGHA